MHQTAPWDASFPVVTLLPSRGRKGRVLSAATHARVLTTSTPAIRRPCSPRPLPGLGLSQEAGKVSQHSVAVSKHYLENERFDCPLGIHGEGHRIVSSSKDSLPLLSSLFFFFMFRAQIDL